MATSQIQPTTNITYKYFVSISINKTPLAHAQSIKLGSERNAETWKQFMVTPGSTTDNGNPLISQEVYPGLQTYTGTLGYVTTYDLFSFLEAIGASNYSTSGQDESNLNYGLDILFQTKGVDIDINVYRSTDSSKVYKTITLTNCWFKSSNYAFDMTQTNPIIIQESDFEFQDVAVKTFE